MNGRTHALTGAAFALGWAQYTGGMDPGALTLFAAATAGTAMLPDADHRHASVAQTFGWPTKIIAIGAEKLFGGHRNGTHSVLFAAAAWFGADLALQSALAAKILLIVALGLGVRALGFTRTGFIPAVVTFIGCWAVVETATGLYDVDVSWLPACYLLGVLAHLGGDCLTPQGCPLLWPYPARFSVPLVRTDGRRENWLVEPALTAACIALIIAYAGLWPHVSASLNAIAGGTP